MKWVVITGSWKITSEKVEKDVRSTAQQIISSGNGVITGGALNVDYFAVEEALKIDPTGKSIKVFLPTSLKIYAQHYRKRAEEGVITSHQAETLINQLTYLKEINPSSLIENSRNSVVTQATYYERHDAELKMADEVVAFHVNQSGGVADTIAKAKLKGLPVKVFNYSVQN